MHWCRLLLNSRTASRRSARLPAMMSTPSPPLIVANPQRMRYGIMHGLCGSNLTCCQSSRGTAPSKRAVCDAMSSTTQTPTRAGNGQPTCSMITTSIRAASYACKRETSRTGRRKRCPNTSSGTSATGLNDLAISLVVPMLLLSMTRQCGSDWAVINTASASELAGVRCHNSGSKTQPAALVMPIKKRRVPIHTSRITQSMPDAR